MSEKLHKENIAGHLRLLFGEEKMNWAAGDNNWLINPGEGLWRWKTIDEFSAEETDDTGSSLVQ